MLCSDVAEHACIITEVVGSDLCSQEEEALERARAEEEARGRTTGTNLSCRVLYLAALTKPSAVDMVSRCRSLLAWRRRRSGRDRRYHGQQHMQHSVFDSGCLLLCALCERCRQQRRCADKRRAPNCNPLLVCVQLGKPARSNVPTFVVQEQAKAEEVLWRLFVLGFHVCALTGALHDVTLTRHWCTGKGPNRRRTTPSGGACVVQRRRRAACIITEVVGSRLVLAGRRGAREGPRGRRGTWSYYWYQFKLSCAVLSGIDQTFCSR